MRFTFVTLNIWLGGKLFDAALDFLKEQNPDILALQEVYNGTGLSLPKNERTVDVIKETLGYEYASFSPCFLDIGTKGHVERGNAIFSRFPLQHVSSIFYDMPYGEYSDSKPEDFPIFPRTLQHATLQIGDKNVDVFNTQGIWGEDGDDSARRLKMGEIIVREIQEKEHVILAGDFNLKPHTKTIKNIESQLTNVFKDELKSTFNMKRKTNPGYATAVVDMVFVSRSIEVKHHVCPNVDISDHLPLVCEFSLKE